MNSNNQNKKAQISFIILGALILFVVIIISYAKRVSYETKMILATKDRMQAYFLSLDALKSIQQILKKDNPDVDSFYDDWYKFPRKGETEYGKWTLDLIYDEECLININKIGKKVLKNIFGSLPEYYLSLLDWLDSDDRVTLGEEIDPAWAGFQGAERDDPFYMSMNSDIGHFPRNGPMRSLLEVFLVKNGSLLTSSQNYKNQKYAYIKSQKQRFNPYFILSLSPFLNYNLNQEPQLKSIKNIKPLWRKERAAYPLIYAHSGIHNSPPVNPTPGPGPEPGPTPPGPTPSPIKPTPPPPLPPIIIPEPAPTGTGLTVYGDGKVNINTALPTVLRALGFTRVTCERLIAYRMKGYKFTRINADYIINSLIKVDLLRPGNPPQTPPESAYTLIVNNIKNVVSEGHLKVNSKYFRVRIKAETNKGSIYGIMAVLKREGNDIKVVAWWENFYL